MMSQPVAQWDRIIRLECDVAVGVGDDIVSSDVNDDEFTSL